MLVSMENTNILNSECECSSKCCHVIYVYKRAEHIESIQTIILGMKDEQRTMNVTFTVMCEFRGVVRVFKAFLSLEFVCNSSNSRVIVAFCSPSFI